MPAERVSEKQYLRSGDVLIATSSSAAVVGKSAVIKDDWHGAHGAFMGVLRAGPSVVPQFLGYYVQSHTVRKRWRTASAGTTINNLKKADLLETSIPLPPQVVQEEIVAVLEESLARLEVAEANLAIAARRKLEVFRRSAVATLFNRPDWPWTTLGEIAEVKGGVQKDSKRQDNPDFVEVPYLRVANVQRGFLDLAEVTTIKVAPKKADQLRLRTGDILFNEGGDRDKLGRGWVWEGQIEQCIHQNHVFRARLTTDRFDPYFLSTHGNTWGQEWFERNGKQTTNLASINLTTLRAFPVPAPSVDEQRELMVQLNSLLQGHERLQVEVAQADAHAKLLRRALLAAAFTGRLLADDEGDRVGGSHPQELRGFPA